MTQDKEQLLQELLHEKLGEFIHYKSTTNNYHLDTLYEMHIDAIKDVIDLPELPLLMYTNPTGPWYSK